MALSCPMLGFRTMRNYGSCVSKKRCRTEQQGESPCTEGEIFLHLILISDYCVGRLKLTQDTSILPRKATGCCSDLMESRLREDSRENDIPRESFS